MKNHLQEHLKSDRLDEETKAPDDELQSEIESSKQHDMLEDYGFVAVSCTLRQYDQLPCYN